MSTEHQQYSILNQVRAIHAYAALRGIEVVRTYADKGKSGLRIQNRDGLKQLIGDVVTGEADYSIVLIYDVSRWGRFQDTDESAHYEFICRQAGIKIEYCAEQFENDGEPLSAIIKSIKRIMAAEYSRELSVKVFAGQERAASSGHHVGGPVSYGLCRVAVDEHGAVKGVLNRGDGKSKRTDRILLAPGRMGEVLLIRWMFKAYASGLIAREIAGVLNKRGIRTNDGVNWRTGRVWTILRNEQYIGTSVWAKQSNKLGTDRKRNSREKWIKKEGAFEPVVSRELFFDVQSKLNRHRSDKEKEQYLVGLKRLWFEKGKLSSELIEKDKRIPSLDRYYHHFGSLQAAYRKIGYQLARNYAPEGFTGSLRKMRLQIAKEVAERVQSFEGMHSEFPHGRTAIIQSTFAVKFVILQCKQTKTGFVRWRYDLRENPDVEIVVAARLKLGNQEIQDYFIFPVKGRWIQRAYISANSEGRFSRYRTDTLDPLYSILSEDSLDDLPLCERVIEAIQRSRLQGST